MIGSAVAGHHCRPPAAIERHLDEMRKRAGAEALADAEAFVRACLDFWPDARLDDMKEKEASWCLAGLTTTADWIGSNVCWFPPVDPRVPLAEHLENARGAARRAVEEAGLAPRRLDAAALFDFKLRPMQAEASRIPLLDGPMLAILEDETGAGKTEAALLLSQRMMLAGKGRGLFFALPTMATADAMFARARGMVRRLFADPPSLTLAHGRSSLSTGFREVRNTAPGSDDPVCGPWLTDDRRRALLADIGVGTIDQALLAVLPTRFAALRCWGLSSKILVVDEVHELGDPYMAEELVHLLRLHAIAGGSAILLSANLPLGLHNRLATAFEAGVGRSFLPDRDASYPSLSIPGGPCARSATPVPSPKGPVRIVRLEENGQALDTLLDAATRGAACVWVRNAVDEAIAAVEALRARGIEADLLHARIGLTPHKAAKLASEDRRSELSQAVRRSCSAGPCLIEFRATRSGASSSTIATIMSSSSAISSCSSRYRLTSDFSAIR